LIVVTASLLDFLSYCRLEFDCLTLAERRRLNLFGDVFERIWADHVETPDDSHLIESAIE
jgi:hypothetical protein